MLIDTETHSSSKELEELFDYKVLSKILTKVFCQKVVVWKFIAILVSISLNFGTLVTKFVDK